MISTDEAVDAFKGPDTTRPANDNSNGDEVQADNVAEGDGDIDHPTERKQTTAMATIVALSAFERRLLGWDLLEACEAAHRGHYSIPSWVKYPNDVVETYECFNHRFEAMATALKKRKALVKNLCDSWFMSQWARRIAIRPGAETKKKDDNKQTNNLRNKQVSFATRNGIGAPKAKERRTKETRPQSQAQLQVQSQSQLRNQSHNLAPTLTPSLPPSLPPDQSCQTVQPGPAWMERYRHGDAEGQVRLGMGPRVARSSPASHVWHKLPPRPGRTEIRPFIVGRDEGDVGSGLAALSCVVVVFAACRLVISTD